MLTFISLSILIYFFMNNSWVFIITMFTSFILFLSNMNSYFNNIVYFSNSFTIYDELSLFMTLLLFFIMFISFVSGMNFSPLAHFNFILISLFFFCYQVFTTNNLFLLYFFYESSLIPILYIIIKWGSYPERSVSAMMLLVYTAVFSAPLLIIILYIYFFFNTMNLDIINIPYSNFSFLFSMFVFLCFAVKLPIFGLHYWLPMAHVEAPTFGSVILASILLKLGGVGLIRLLGLMNLSSLINFTLSYFMIFTIFSTIVCCFQSDLKRLIAYSSVSHMMVIPFLIYSNNILSIQSIIMVMVFHGLSSTLLFMSVGTLYSMYSTRQLLLMRGLVLISPLFTFFLILTFFFTLSAPPFPSFVAEAFFMMSSFMLSSKMALVFIPFAFLGLVYNLNWLTSVNFSTSLNMVYTESLFKFNVFMPFMLIFIKTFMLLFFFNYF